MKRGPYNVKTPTERFLKRFTVANSGCWEWVGGSQAYPLFYMGKNVQAHRAAIMLLTDRVIPEGYEVDHMCSNNRCVNPTHLDVVTPEENTRRALIRDGKNVPGAEYCTKGHRMTESNTTMILNRGKHRARCRTCINDAKRVAYKRKQDTTK